VGGKPVKVAFALLIPEKSRGTLHMRYLQNIATALLDNKFNQVILNSTNKNLIINTITKAIEKDEQKEITKEKQLSIVNKDLSKTNQSNNKLIVGVSSCATGVAHTYMAREALEKHGKDVGYDV
jgi:hypothetical protein